MALRKPSGHGPAGLTCKAAKGGQPGISDLTLLLLTNAGSPGAGTLLPNAGGVNVPDGGAEVAVGPPDAGQLLPDAGVEASARPGCKCRANVSLDLQASELQTFHRARLRAEVAG